MKPFWRAWGQGPRKKGLDLPAPPLGPPPFLGGRTPGRTGQLRAYQGWVYAAVTAIARRVAAVPLGLRDPAGELTEHPLLDLLARPNPLLSGRALRQTLVTHLELTGMAFLLVADNALGRPAELWPLCPADLIEIETGDDTRQPLRAFVFRGPGGRAERFAPEEVLYFRHPSPVSLVYGASPIEAMAHAYDIDLAVRVYQRNFFRNSARPELVFSTDQRLSDQDARRILGRWNQKHQGLEHAFEPTLLDAGLKVEPLTFSARDFEFMALAGWTQDNILAAYGVPAGKLGLVKDVNRANAQGIDLTFNSECVKPRLDLIEEVLQTRLVPRFGPGLGLGFANPVPGDQAQEHRLAMDRLDRGVLTINEVRAQLGRGPVPWGEEPRPAALAPAAPILDAAQLRAVAARVRQHWPRLLARFRGWSTARLLKELAEHPRHLAQLLPPGLPPAPAARLRLHLRRALLKERGLNQTLGGLPRASKGV